MQTPSISVLCVLSSRWQPHDYSCAAGIAAAAAGGVAAAAAL